MVTENAIESYVTSRCKLQPWLLGHLGMAQLGQMLLPSVNRRTLIIPDVRSCDLAVLWIYIHCFCEINIHLCYY